MARRLNDTWSRRIARRTRDWHWNFMRRLARRGIVHVNLWNKYRQKEWGNELRLDMISGVELAGWIRDHRSWFGYGPHNYSRHTFPCWLTSKGRQALRSLPGDALPVFGGFVDPGYQSVPLDYHRDLNEQRVYLRALAGLSRPAFIPREMRVKIDLPLKKMTRRRQRKAA